MLQWICANPGTILICIALVAVVALILYSLIRQHKQGKSSCGCGCSGYNIFLMCQSRISEMHM